MLKLPPLVCDTGIIIRFGRTEQIEILKKLYSGNIILPTEVINECIIGEKLHENVRDALQEKWMEEFSINFVDYPNICLEYAKLNRQFGAGESAVMAIAKEKGWTVGSDDLRATKKFCTRNKIPLMGSLGILFDAYDKDFITASEGQQILNDMISITGYKSPVNQFSDIENWFGKGQGKQLF
ncbi:hypothetical protein [Bacillus altitudinis]|uniref:hypothetical protein n=1 Tax=Bacillus altitudinis TaxID=293387 RepID=UPI0024093D6E|nr:hypothetical protein [Bacillus altitudinis]WEZ69913.1 hypothetical protein P5623_11830 [Bacillus altitudinis]